MNGTAGVRCAKWLIASYKLRSSTSKTPTCFWMRLRRSRISHIEQVTVRRATLFYGNISVWLSNGAYSLNHHVQFILPVKIGHAPTRISKKRYNETSHFHRPLWSQSWQS